LSEFTAQLPDIFANFGPVSVRAMFGGYGVYHDSLMFALVADDELYLKVDEQSRDEFVQHGLGQFIFRSKKGKPMSMNYYRAPEEIFEDQDRARYWAELAWRAALRAQSRKGARKQPRKS